MTLGEKIKFYRDKKGLTQEELGKVIGVKGATITRYEKNDRQPKIDQLIKIAEVLDISVYLLVGGEGSNPELYNEVHVSEISKDISKLINSNDNEVYMLGNILSFIISNTAHSLITNSLCNNTEYKSALTNLLFHIADLIDPQITSSDPNYLYLLNNISDYIDYKYARFIGDIRDSNN